MLICRKIYVQSSLLISKPFGLKKKDFELSEIQIIRIHEERELKKCGIQIRNVQVGRGLGVGLTPFSLVALLQTLACNVGGQTHTHTHTPQSLAVEHSTTCTLFYKPGKVFHCVKIKKLRQNRFKLIGSLFQNSN